MGPAARLAQEDLGALTTLEAVKRAARDWAANDRAADWLNHAGGRLEDAEQVAARPDFAADLSDDARDYLRHCREAEAARRREREAAQARAQKLQRRVLSAVTVGLVAALVLAGLAGWQWRTAQTQQTLAEAHLAEARLNQSQFLTTRAQEALATGQPELAGLIARAALPADMTKPDRPLWFAAVATLTQARDTDPQRAIMAGHTNKVASAAWSPDGARIVTASADNTARVWDAKTGAQLALLQGHTGPVYSAAWSPDGARIVTASWDNTARVWDAKSGAQLALLGHTGPIYSAAWSPDGTRIVTASDDKTARVWDAKTGVQLALLQGHTGAVVSAAWSPDGTRIVTASSDNTARVWNAKTEVQLVLIEGHTSWVVSAAWSPDGARVVTASQDGTARVWDARTGAQLAQLKGNIDAVLSAAWSPDGTRIVTAEADYVARVWDAWSLLTADTVVYADLTALRALTAGERAAVFLNEPAGASPQQVAAAEPAALCDQLAANPFDPKKRAPGVMFSDIDPDKAVSSCRAALAAKPNEPRLRYQLGRALERAQKLDEAVAEYRASADTGYPIATYNLALAYERGTGAAKDYAEALKLYEKSAAGGFGPAFSQVGRLYWFGLGVGADRVEALRWFERGSERDDPFSDHRLAELYETGDGVAKDLEKALFYHAVEARLFEKVGDEPDAVAARARRGSDARTLAPEAVVRVAHEVMSWKPTTP